MQRDVMTIRCQVRGQSAFENGFRTPGTQGTEKRHQMRSDAAPTPQTQDKFSLMKGNSLQQEHVPNDQDEGYSLELLLLLCIITLMEPGWL